MQEEQELNQEQEKVESAAPEKEQQDQPDTEAQTETEGAEDETNDETEITETGEETAEDGEEQPEKPVGRAQARIRKQQEELKAERAEKEKLIAERAVAQSQLEQMRQQQQQIQSAAEKRAEDERLALLDPQERAVYQANQQIRTLEYRLNQMEVRRADDADRAQFHAKAAHDPAYQKYADKVEKMYQEGVARGVHASREDLHSYILGQELKKDLASKVSKKKETASKRIDTVTSKPASAKGDVAGSKKGKSEEDRLRGVLI